MQTGLKQTDFLLIEDLFKSLENGPGYVLNFTNPTFGDFFRREIGVNIDDPRFEIEGTSKGKRLRYFLKSQDTTTVVRTLLALWEYREAYLQHKGETDSVRNASVRFLDLISRLTGKTPIPPSPKGSEKKHAVGTATLARLAADLTALVQLEPHPRGYKFESFLKELFDAHGLKAAEPFRNRGEQIDGSFELDGHTYLMEAKWHGAKTGADDLHTFHGKLEQKAAWARGLFVSYSGFTDEGLAAFGRGKKVICMDGRDLFDTLSRGLSLVEVLKKKDRKAVETGSPFVPVWTLF